MSNTLESQQLSAAIWQAEQQQKHQDEKQQLRQEADIAKERFLAIKERDHRVKLIEQAQTVESIHAAAGSTVPESKPKPFDPTKLRRTFQATQTDINDSIVEGLQQRINVGNKLNTLIEQGRITHKYALEQMQESAEANNIVNTLDAAIISAEAQIEEAQQRTEALRAEHLIISDSENPTEQLLAETRAQRTWDRLKNELDKRDDLQAMKHLGVVLQDADKQTRAIIMQEAPSYFTTIREYHDAPSIIDLHLRAAVPELRDALEAESLAEKHYLYVRNNVKRVREQLDTNPFNPPAEPTKIAGYLQPEKFGK